MDEDQKIKKIENKLDELLNSRFAWLQSSAADSQNRFSQSVNLGAYNINLRDLLIELWRGKWRILAVTMAFAITSVFYVLSLPDIYKSEVLLSPVEKSQRSDLAGMAGGLSGLASFAGFDIGLGSKGNKVDLALEVVKSREFISYFIQKRDLLVPLMAAVSWDRGSQELIIDEDIYSVEQKKWVRTPPFPLKQIPSMQEAREKFLEYFDVVRDPETGFIIFSIEFYSPELAKQWLDWLVEDINFIIKSRDVLEAQRSINYLVKQLEKTSVAEMRAMFYELIEEQTKTIMFAEVGEEYAFRTIDKAIVPELKYKPRRSLYCILATLLGGTIACFWLMVSYFWRTEA